MKFGIISGSFFYDFQELEDQHEIIVTTDFGEVPVLAGHIGSAEVAFVNRHGKGHQILPHQINHRANISALSRLGVSAIIATTVVGVVQPEFSLAKLFVFDDLFFPDNRLPNGELCTIFSRIGSKDRGHLIFNRPFAGSLRKLVIDSIQSLGLEYYDRAVYGHVNGPRFNSRAEIAALAQYGVSAVSQTAGPEIVLSGELEIPYQLIGFGSDYANGVSAVPTSLEELNANLSQSRLVFSKAIIKIIQNAKPVAFDNGFVYRLES